MKNQHLIALGPISGASYNPLTSYDMGCHSLQNSLQRSDFANGSFVISQGGRNENYQ